MRRMGGRNDAKGLVHRGGKLRSKGLHDEALDAFARAAELDADNADAHAGRAGELAALGRHAEALDAYDRALEIYPTRPSFLSDKPPHPNAALAQVGRGDVLWSLGRHKDAADSYGDAISTHERTIQFNKEEAERQKPTRLLFTGDEADDDKPSSEDAEPIPGHVEAYHKRALALLEHGDLDEAVADCERAIEIDPDYAPVHRTHALALHEFERSDERPLDELVAALNRAIGADPDYAPVRAARGDALCELGCHSYALAEYDRAIRLDPGNAKTHHSRGRALAALGRHDEALAELDRALDLDRTLPDASLDRSRTLSALGRHDEALAACDLALAARPNVHVEYNERVNEPVGPDSPRFHAVRGLALDGLGRHADALLAFERADKLGYEGDDIHACHVGQGGSGDAPAGHHRIGAPGTRHACTWAFGEDDPVAHRAHAMTLQSLDRHDSALAAYDRAIELDPGCAAAHCDRASVLLSLGRPADALASLDRAAALKPGNPEFHARRARILATLGLDAEADEARRRAGNPGRA